MKCNLFNILDKNNGEFYLFSQFAEDSTKEDALKSSYRVIPSKFATMNITIPENIDDIDKYIAEAFQNYENKCLFIKQQLNEKFTPEITNNLLWNSLEEAGFINLTAYSSTDNLYNIKIFPELNFVGDINIYNSKRYNDTNYNEIYCHVGSENRSRYYAVEEVGTRQIFAYNKNTLIGWEDFGASLPNDTSNTPMTDNGVYSIFGNHMPNILNPYFNDINIDIDRPSLAENVNVTITQEGDGITYANVMGNGFQEVINTDGGSYNVVLNSDIREVVIKPNSEKILIDGFKYNSDDVNMVGHHTIIENFSNGIKINPQDGSIRISNSYEDLFQINAIIVFYDIYNGDSILYKNIPMGIYFTGKYDPDMGVLRNTVIKYSNHDDVFGQGSSYNLRICTRNIVTPQGMLKYDTQIVGDGENYDNLASIMGGLHDLIISVKNELKNNTIQEQLLKEHLSMFKNYRVNVPYIRNVGGKNIWFVNGRNTEIEA